MANVCVSLCMCMDVYLCGAQMHVGHVEASRQC